MKYYVDKSKIILIAEKLLQERGKSLLTKVMGFLGICVLMGTLLGLANSGPSSGNFAVYIFIAGFACSFVAANIFSDFATKEGMISVLMNPAPASTKFLIRIVAVLLGSVIMTVIGYLVFGYSDILALGVKYDTWVNLYSPFYHWNEYYTQTLFIFLSIFLFTDSIFVLGSILWPRRTFVKTVCFLTAFLLLIGLFFWLMAIIAKNKGVYFQVVDERAFTWSVISLIIIAAVAVTCLAYRFFKRKTIA